MKNVLVPGWIFEEEHRGEYFLLTFDGGGLASVDGGHSSPVGVGTADKLIKTLALPSSANGTRVMIRVCNVPSKSAKINKRAVEACKSNMLAR